MAVSVATNVIIVVTVPVLAATLGVPVGNRSSVLHVRILGV